MGLWYFFSFFIFYFCLLIHYCWPAVHQSGPPCVFSLNSHQFQRHPLPPLPSQQPKQCLLALFRFSFTSLATVHPPVPSHSTLPSQQPKWCLLALFGLSSCHSPPSTPPMLSANPHHFCSPIRPSRAFSLNSRQLHRHPLPPLPSQQPKWCLLALFGLLFLSLTTVHPPMPSHSTPINTTTIHCHLFHLNSPNGAFWHCLGFHLIIQPLCSHSTPINSTATSSISTAVKCKKTGQHEIPMIGRIGIQISND